MCVYVCAGWNSDLITGTGFKGLSVRLWTVVIFLFKLHTFFVGAHWRIEIISNNAPVCVCMCVLCMVMCVYC